MFDVFADLFMYMGLIVIVVFLVACLVWLTVLAYASIIAPTLGRVVAWQSRRRRASSAWGALSLPAAAALSLAPGGGVLCIAAYLMPPGAAAVVVGLSGSFMVLAGALSPLWWPIADEFAAERRRRRRDAQTQPEVYIEVGSARQGSRHHRGQP